MTRPYPDKNPFPYQGTMTIGPSSDPESDDSYRRERTLELDPVKKLLKHLNDYFVRVKSGDSRQGHFVALRGDHGSGKTHALKYGMDWVKDRYGDVDSNLPKPAQLYAQATKPDFLFVYRQLISQISFDDLKDLNIRFLGVVASEQIGKGSSDASAKNKIAAKLRENPSKLFELFRSYLVEEGAVNERQREEVKSLSADGGDDFRRAFSYILSPELGRSAYNWLIGQPISDEEAKRLGVSGAINTGEGGVIALQLLAALFNRIGRPLLVFVDQYEKLVLAEDKILAAGNAGMLHSLLQKIPKANGLFLIAGNEESWDVLPRDLKSRFAGNVVDFPVLKPDDAREIILLYLTPTEGEITPEISANSTAQGDDEYYPFAAEATRSIVSYSMGNIRKLLQICSKVFEAAAPKRELITTSLVDKVLAESNLAYYSTEDVRNEIERIVVQYSLKYVRGWRVGDVEVDLAVLNTDNKPTLLFEINEASFHEQEAQRALEALGRVQRIRQQGIDAPIVFIALGYVSEQVTKTVREFAQDFLIYKPEVFAVEVGKILGKIKESSSPSTDSVKYIETLEGKLRDLSSRLEDVLKDRKAESEVMDKRLAEFFDRQSVDRLEEKRQAARPAWAEERRRIEKEIQDVRQQRSESELREMERLRDRAEDNRKRRAWLQALVIFLTAMGFLIYRVVYRINSYPFATITDALAYALRNPMIALLVFIALLLGVMLILRARNLIGPSLYRELAAPVGSKQELERLSRQYSMMVSEESAGWKGVPFIDMYRSFVISIVNPFPRSMWGLLRDENPHYRYTGVILCDPNQDHKRLVRILKAERSTIVRRAIAQRINGEYLNDDDLKDLRSNFVLELAYVIDNGSLRGKIVSELPERLYALSAFHRIELPYPSSTPVLDLVHEYGPYYNAYHSGLDRIDAGFSSHFRETDVREAIAELSPFDQGGLGTLDELKVIKQIDQFYLFFRQLLFFIERDLLPTTPPLVGQFTR